MRYACWNTIICVCVKHTNNQCVILIIGGREILRPYPNVGYCLEKFDAVFFQEIILSSGVFRRERRAVFILGAKWIALARGWRSDCVVGGMETRFQ